MNKANLKTMLLNPIILATFGGLLIWVFQAYLPQVTVGTGDAVKQVAFLRIDQTARWLHQPLTFLAALTSPLAWLSIGSTLAQISLSQAFSNKTALFYSITKTLFIPALTIAGLLVVNLFIPVSFLTVAVSAIMMATPPATVAVAYAIKFEREALLASNCSLVATVLAVFVIPVVILVLEVLKSFNLFA